MPLHRFERVPGLPPVRLGSPRAPDRLTPPHAHAHDFLVLAYLERGGGSIRLGGREWILRAGDALVVAPGEVVVPGADDRLHGAEVWTVAFPADVIEPGTPGAFLSWRAHPLLFPFARGVAGGVQRLAVPPEDRPAWSERLAALERELAERRDGYNEAVLAYLTLLLVSLSRLAADVAGNLELRDEPLLAAVFEVVETRYNEPVSLRDVARAVGLTPGHLTTVVRRKTGRTVLQWLTERRMAEARRLLAGTDLPVETVAARVGYRDAGYFGKTFRRGHGVTPLSWRGAGHR
ncbi:MAG: helix-turn-helix domain-containing protein [Pseudonocardiaceae bacterium]|nr:helix-turn-helix domain-containing protein [Pseudonocardiaceae bacterium]